jgi:hypothetical protein
MNERASGQGIVQTTVAILIMLAAAIAVAGVVLYERSRWHRK